MQTGVGQASVLFTDTPWWLPLSIGLVGGFAVAATAHWAVTSGEQVAKVGAKYAPLLLAENPRPRGRRRR
jgi:hypothetical protein